ncbi:MAG: PHB depolymerase family esterase [Halioglobus sp.]
MSIDTLKPLLGLVLAVLFTAGCSDGSDNFTVSKLGGCSDTNTCVSNPPLELNAARPANVHIPADYNTATRYPLVIVLHGFGASGFIQSLYFGLLDRVDPGQFVLIAPDGTVNTNGSRFWNATPACCAGQDPAQQVDDVGYIRSLISEAAQTYSIDEERIGLIGHSNGGFMSLRMACEASELISSVVSLAGSTFADAASCGPADNPVSVLAVHGDDDATISYDGREGEFGFPSAPITTERFAQQAGCDINNPLTPPAINLMDTIDGNETTVIEYTGCEQNSEVTLWTIVDGPHIPLVFNAAALDSFVAWLVNHPRT